MDPAPPESPLNDEATPAHAAPRVEQRAGQGEDGRADLQVIARGRWTALACSSPRDWKALVGMLASMPASGDVAWELRTIDQIDHIGAQMLWNHWNHEWPAQVEMTQQQKAILEQVALFTVREPEEPAPTLVDHFKKFANRGPHMLETTRRFITLIGQFVFDVGRLIRAPHLAPWRDISGHLYSTGATALPITALVGLLIGVVLAYLTSQQLRQYGAETFIVNILGLSLIRELGPVLAAVLIAGRSGSAMTAQIGVMRVTEEMDAMRVMGIPHGFRLVMPRVLALAIAMPLISIWTSGAAMLGGMIAADVSLGISPSFFMQALPRAVPLTNIWLAISKSAVFGILIALIACYHGMRVLPNTESLGRRTTSSVVISITVVILVDALFAVLFKGVGFR
ncbi:ABC transporter permease [Variovorax sp. J22R133]|uniref:MlaE family ABC transporter permease n=1 Tax=Variovorax brevis TaxID=3053503 RepID=UPI0025750B88|nr:ABC transporter permease [Variovorax sp. J22R133]MDM0117407.1 ABC transporter permease [Variovorax sp. J22R133]